MKILSLFDGISCGRVALDRAGIPVDAYFASEVDKYAIQVSRKNYPEIIHLGDVTKWREWDIPWEEIDLLIGGSPCTGFSSSGKGLGFNDPRSALFFSYVEILTHLKEKNPGVKFFLENVKMKKSNENIITQHLGVHPVEINSADLSAQLRKRLYWANWPIPIPQKKNLTLSAIIDSGWVDREKSYCIDACYHKGGDLNQYLNKSRRQLVFTGEDMSEYRKLTPQECEKLQTLPVGYTECISNTQRYRCLGNGWTVDVIAHCFRYLPQAST